MTEQKMQSDQNIMGWVDRQEMVAKPSYKNLQAIKRNRISLLGRYVGRVRDWPPLGNGYGQFSSTLNTECLSETKLVERNDGHTNGN